MKGRSEPYPPVVGEITRENETVQATFGVLREYHCERCKQQDMSATLDRLRRTFKDDPSRLSTWITT